MTTTKALMFSKEEIQYLYKVAESSIAQGLNNPNQRAEPLTPPDSALLNKPLGVFVTLKRGSALRGCIGTLVGIEPLFINVSKMAKAAAFNDPRFPPLKPEELKDLNISITVMGEITHCPDPKKIALGRHGLIMRTKDGRKQGLLLPQVPLEQGWDLDTFLAHTCIKAGLPPTAWKDENVEILWFEGIIL